MCLYPASGCVHPIIFWRQLQPWICLGICYWDIHLSPKLRQNARHPHSFKNLYKSWAVTKWNVLTRLRKDAWMMPNAYCLWYTVPDARAATLNACETQSFRLSLARRPQCFRWIVTLNKFSKVEGMRVSMYFERHHEDVMHDVLLDEKPVYRASKSYLKRETWVE